MKNIFLIFFLSKIAAGTVLNVPLDYPTIQSALDATSDGDTVLVSIGIYPEALSAPQHAFVLKGNVQPDTGNYPRPTIDPSSLPDPTTLCCLTMSFQSKATVEDFHFRNGPEMYPHLSTNSGGIMHVNDTLTVNRCIFDSVYKCIRSNGSPVRVADSRFHGVNFCIASPDWLSVSNCDFSSDDTGAIGIFAQETSIIGNSRFHDFIGGLHFLWLTGGDHIIHQCIFDHTEYAGSQAIFASSFTGIIENNLFEQCNTGVIIWLLNMSCLGDVAVRRNIFNGNINTNPFVGCRCLDIQSDIIVDADCIVVDSNLFRENLGMTVTKCLFISSTLTLTNNRIFANHAENIPAIFFANEAENELSFIEGNKVASNNFAINCEIPDTVNARFNWWGDSTGPRSINNPGGLGDSIGANVLFDPWYIDSTGSLDSPEHNNFIPDKASLEAYPNPFNLETTLKLSVPNAMIVRVELFDILGRSIKDIWSGPLSYEKEIKFSASGFSSGVYFARAYDTIHNRPVAMAKLLLLK